LMRMSSTRKSSRSKALGRTRPETWCDCWATIDIWLWIAGAGHSTQRFTEMAGKLATRPSPGTTGSMASGAGWSCGSI